MDSGTAVYLVMFALGAVSISVGVHRVMRDRWDLLFEHSRDLFRHALGAILMLGTLAGTFWTFSAGRLAFSGIIETLISVGGIALALEAGVMYTGWYLGKLDARIATAKKGELHDDMVSRRKELNRWFYVIAAISAVANLIYRSQQLNNFLLAAFVSIAPIILVVLFFVKLRPIPQDYAEIGRQSIQRGLVSLANESQKVMMRTLRKIGKGHVITQAEQMQFAMAVSLTRAYASGAQQQALDSVIGQYALPAPQDGASASYGPNSTNFDAPAERGAAEWWTAADISRLYGVAERTAQNWMSQTPGRRLRPHSRLWEAPSVNVYAAHGVPANQSQSGPTRRRTRRVSQPRVEEMPRGADDLSSDVAITLEAVPVPNTEGVYSA